MASDRRGQKPGAKCAQFWCLLDEDAHRVVAEWPCYSWRCPACGPKREAEATEMLRLRLAGWQDDPGATPNFITLTCDPSALPGKVRQGSNEEDGYLRTKFGEVMRQLNQEERRAGRPRIQYVAVVERGKRSQNWHLHLVTDREIHVDRWRRVAVAHGLGKVVKAKRLDGARGAAVYLATYLRKGSTPIGRKRRVLLHSRHCLPSQELWRWRRANGRPFLNASSWTRESLRLQNEHMRADKEYRRREREENATGPMRVRASVEDPGGGRRVIVNQRVRPRFCSPIRRKRPTRETSSRARPHQASLTPPTATEASSGPSQPPHGGSEEAVD